MNLFEFALNLVQNFGTMTDYSFKKTRSLNYRIWHWLNALAITGLLATVLLRKTFLSWRTNSALIRSKLEEVGTTITPEFAKEMAVAIRDPLWDLHIYLGFALTWLLIWRVGSFFFDRKHPSTSFLKALKGLKLVPPPEKQDAVHYTAVKFTYILFYIATLFMVVTGLMLTFKVELNLAKDFAGSVKDLHELAMWFFVGFVAVHLIKVIHIEFTKAPGIVSDMINGKKN